MPNLLLREINSFRSRCHVLVAGKHLNTVVALCISVPKKSMISGGCRSSTLFTYCFQLCCLLYFIAILFNFIERYLL